jgi:hypothetical protein
MLLPMAGSGFVEYVEATDKFSFHQRTPLFFLRIKVLQPYIPVLSENASYQYTLLKLAYESNGGVFWGDMHGMTKATKFFFKPVFEKKLLPLWIDLSLNLSPNLSLNLKAMLSTNGCKVRVANIGCGCRVSTRSLANSFPIAKFIDTTTMQRKLNEPERRLSRMLLPAASKRRDTLVRLTPPRTREPMMW